MIRTRRILEMYLGVLVRLTLVRFRPRIVAVTGSVGKTTTITVINGLLADLSGSEIIGPFRSNATNNMNGTVGVFLTVLGSSHFVGPSLSGLLELVRLTAVTLNNVFKPGATYPEVLLLECGISGKGEMRRMARTIQPNVVIVTTVGHAHLEKGMSTVRDIAKEKSELVLACKREGLVILGSDNEWTRGMAELTQAPVKLVKGRGVVFGVSVARLVAEWLGVDGAAIEPVLRNPATPPHRLERIDGAGFLVIDDTFNANPLSMKLALDTLQSEQCSGRKVAILGQMKELGPDSRELHREIGAYAKAKADVVIGVGEELGHLYEPDCFYRDSAECAHNIGEWVAKGDCVLVKGSHSVGMLRVVQALTEGGERNGGS
ncbi:Mur ligase family protein [Marinobacter sp. 71-i]|uniref:Mur ligase family protein n=1 Tax=Marinobacter iranensis TaxID=2962607 RepID=A0ABT5YES8_9GAMM|nr:Mur ligase family protein [Marinobacter iranensis]MDF0752173.1 Mur ligase family protein [Marinobacter iranensis]